MESLDRNHSALWDMAEAIREIQSFTEAVTKEEYLETLWLKRVVERNFEILGEAARHVSIEFQQAHPEIDWPQILPILEELAPPLPENEPD
jgi:uncharacterized protein with HEPN domain